jgi:iron transport multicopper oxidase
VTVSVAQRVSVLVTARNDTASNWLIHANMVRIRIEFDGAR